MRREILYHCILTIFKPWEPFIQRKDCLRAGITTQNEKGQGSIPWFATFPAGDLSLLCFSPSITCKNGIRFPTSWGAVKLTLLKIERHSVIMVMGAKEVPQIQTDI